MAAILYKQAELTDVPGLVGLPQPGEAGGDRRMPQYLAREHHPVEALPPRTMYMATSGDSPVGYAAGHLTRRFGCDGELQWIYVVPAYRRAHVASELLHLLAKWFVDNGARRICVDVGSEFSRPFYGHHGAVDLNPHWMVWPDIARVLEQQSGAAKPS